MDIFAFALNGNYGRFYKNLKEISKTNHIPAFIMFIDAAISVVLFGSGLSDYLNYEFYKKSYCQRAKYVTIGYQAKAYEKLANIKYSPYISNKTSFHKNYSKFTKRSYIDLADASLQDFLAYTDKYKSVVMKPVLGSGGESVEAVDLSGYSKEQLTEMFAQLKEKKMFIEERVVQDERWNKLSPNSLNTLRVMTCVIDGEVELLYAATRIGSGKSVADNFHQGGMGIAINLQTGCLRGVAIDKEGIRHAESPTGVVLDGYQVPYWDEVKQMVKEAALVNQDIHFVGWDVALSDKGPLIIEGNRGPGFDLPQMTEEKGLKYMLKDNLKKLKEVEKRN